ncbi:MAG TPA: hypothetical protein VF283_14960 [Bryobacteraceae bacterium]
MGIGLLAFLLASGVVGAEQSLPPVYDGSVIAGPGRFRHNGPLCIAGHVTLRNLTLDLRGPIRVASGASFELDHVHLIVSDPPGAQNGTSGLRCEGPAHIVVRSSTMKPSGSAHPMWLLKGSLTVDDFQTSNSEFHLEHVKAQLNRLKIFELEVSHESHVVADHLTLVFLSTHTGDDDHLNVSGIPTDKPFTHKVNLGSGATADLTDTTVQLFLVYVHGRSHVALNHMGRVQLAIFPHCNGRFRLPKGRLGSAAAPVSVPAPGNSNCPFGFKLNDVNVDTWDVYAGGNADLSFTGSRIDELTADGSAKINVRDSELYADWLSLAGDADLHVEDSTVGALRLASERPDLATSQIRLRDRSRAVFTRVRFDCGLVAIDHSHVEIRNPITRPKYVRESGAAQVRR